MPAPKKFENNLMAEKSDDSLVPISETLQQNTIKIHPHTNTDHITSLSPPKVTPKFYPHGQDGPKRKITPILTAPAYTSPQRTRRFGKTDNVFSEIKLKTPKKRAVEIFDSSKMRAPKLIQPSGLLSSKIEEVNPQDTVKMDASKVTKTDPVEMKIATDTSNMTSANKNDDKATNSAKNNKQDSKISPQENLEEFKTDISKEQKAQNSETKETVSPISEQIAPKPSADIPKPSADIPKPSADIPQHSQTSLQQKLKMPEIIVLDNVSMSKEATDNQTVSQPILTTTETSGNRHQTIAISVAGPNVSRTSGKADFGTDSSSREIPDPTPSKTAGQKIPETTDMSAGGQSKGSKESSGKTITGREASEVSASKTNQPKENNGSEVSVKEQNDSPKGFPTSSEKNVSDGQAENPEEVIRNTVPKVSAPRQTLVSEDSTPKDVPIETSSILQSSVSAVDHNTTSMGTSLSIEDTSEKEKDKRNLAVSVISVSKSKGIVTKHNGSSSQANEARSKGTHKDQKSEETTMEREQKSLDGQKPLNDSSDSHRNHGPSETLVQKTWDRNSEDAGVKDQQSTEMLNWSKPKDVKRKTSLHIMSTATEKKRRDSVAYLPTRPTPAPTKQRRVSLATNPSIPKRRTSVHEQLSTKTEVSKFSQKLTNLLKESGFGYKLEESSLKLEIPVCKISNDHQEIQVVSETSLKDGVRSLKPGVTILNDGWLDEEFLTLLKTRLETGDSIKRKTSLTELVPETQSKDIQKDCIKVLVNKKDIIQVILTAITTFQDRQSLQTLACMSLLKIASISESNCEILKECEGLSTLNTIFKCYNDNITVQKLILTTWAYMSATESLCKDMLNYGIHTEILETMSRRPDDSNIIKQSCFILANLVNTEETAKQIMLVGGVHTVINVIEKYHQHSAILENGCRALGSFAAFGN
ncbi:hypothetical protein LOTGIDRAFT_167490 [Lottia gigantea]|uniref:Armadillo repeat-containing domain-containing protein n=1 Tax=Lottia gigantea TaxID=225164 RepID=V4BAK0_LOTGI|nr:hypothetical protein LOTGIDRAFT_167490 [Lottia gigantea]ESO85994.1 hypothetical protein LOTGIDRAFT_167490 [Lottia gigantea]